MANKTNPEPVALVVSDQAAALEVEVRWKSWSDDGSIESP